MQALHILHDIGSCALHAGSLQLQLNSAQIRHGRNTGEQMTPDLAIRPVAYGIYAVTVLPTHIARGSRLLYGKTAVEDIGIVL